MTFREQVEAHINAIGALNEGHEMIVAVAAHCYMLESIFEEITKQGGHTLTFAAEICKRACGAVVDEVIAARGGERVAEKPGTGLVQ